jgi:SOS response regulatory protein OraA/RecX
MTEKRQRKGEPVDRERPSAVDAALRLLGRRDHFRAELERKLGQRGYPPDEIGEALARVAELGYLDDAALARGEVERLRRRKGLGRAGLAAELLRKGVEAGTVDGALTSVTAADERRRAREAGERWLRSHPPDAAALSRHLGRKGYAGSVVLGVVAELVPVGERPAGEDPE